MKGLLLKDFMIVKNQMRYLGFIAFVGIMLMMTNNDMIFGISYITFVFALFTISTIAYDDMNGGTAFLLTLPVTRKTYVMEKYMFGAICSFTSWAGAIIIYFAISIFKNIHTDMQEFVFTILAIIMIVCILLSIMLPIQIKFGAEKSRIAMMLMGGIAFLIGIGGGKLFSTLDIDVVGALDKIVQNNEVTIILLSALITSIIVFVTIKICEKIITNREY